MRPLLQFLSRNYFFFLFVILEGLAVFMVVRNNYYQQSVIFNAANSFTGYTYSIYSNIAHYFSLAEENRLLAEENAMLKNRSASSYIASDMSVFVQNDTIFRQRYEYVAARVINNTTSRKDNYFMLDKGSNHGIVKDMAVISPVGVAGIVTEVSQNFSTVRSVLHSKSGISAKFLKNNYSGTVVWDGRDFSRGKLRDIPTHVMPEPGDSIVTSGYSTSFPEGIMIGVIEDFGTNAGKNFYDINIRFSTEFNSISYVYVIRNLMKEELDKLDKTIKDE